MPDQESTNQGGVFCPVCGKERVPTFDGKPASDEGTTLDDHGRLVPDLDLLPDLGDWIPVHAGIREVWLCPDCVTVEEERRFDWLCIRCGREDEEGNEVWTNDGVCVKCQTHGELRALVLEYVRWMAESIASVRADGDWGRAVSLGLLDTWDNALAIMRERAVPNHLHYTDPINPFIGDDELAPCWDAVSDELQREINVCSEMVFKARYAIPDGIPEGGYPLHEAVDWWLTLDWWPIERTIRRYVAEVREAARGAMAQGGA